MLLLIDNYDSFTYNLAQYFEELGQEVMVVRNDAAAVGDIERWNPSHLVISPGPCTPNEAGISLEAVRVFAGRLPILGVCLGHQVIGSVFGGRIVRARTIMHGKVSQISHCGRGIFRGIANPFRATRYHSLVVERASLPAVLEMTAETTDGEIMALSHRGYAATETPVEGVQFHPESIMTPAGKAMLANFLRWRWR
ncbi:MAG: aminodeoxychorismate/anthranilate synthase component II [Pseudomonadota bacterium]